MAKPRLFLLFLKTAGAGASFGLAILTMMWAFRVSESEPVAVIEKPLPAPGSSIVMLPEDQPLPTFEPTHMRQPPTEVTEPPVPAQPEPEPEPDVPLPAVTVQPPQRIPAVKPEAPRTPHDRYKVTLRSVHVRPNYQNPANGYVHVKACLFHPKKNPA